jgi:hypothetical protein
MVKHFSISNSIIFLIAAILLSLSCRAVSAQECWMNIFLQDKKIGYIYNMSENTSFNDEDVFAFRTKIYMKIQRFLNETEVRNTHSYYLGADMKPRAFVISKYTSSSDIETITGIIANNQIEIKTSLRKSETQKQVLDLPDNFAFESQIKEEMIAEGLHIGQKRDFITFNEEFDEETNIFNRITIEVTEQKRVDFNGKEENVFIVKTIIHNEQPLNAIEWLDTEGNSLQLVVEEMGISFRKTTKEDALASFPGLMMISTMIPVDVLLPSHHKIIKLEVKIISGNQELSKYFISDDRQYIEKRDQGNGSISHILIVKSHPFSDTDSINLPIPIADVEKENLASYLKPTKYIQSEDTEIISLAGEIAGNNSNAWVISKKIYRWIADNITDSYEVVFASAKEVLQLRKGDCTEHAVLFAAIARASGIPTKICMGLVYTPLGGFLFHAWNEVYAGTWVPIDASFKQTMVDATHLKTYEGAMVKFVEQGGVITRLIDQLRLEVINYRLIEGVVTAPDTTQKPIIYENMYINPEFTISISHPEGWSMSMDTPMKSILVTIDNHNKTANTSLFVESLDTEMSLEKYQKEVEKMFKQLGDSYKKESLKKISFKNYESLEHNYLINMSGMLVRGKQFCIIKNPTTIIVLTFTGLDETFNQIWPEFEVIMDSLTF